MPVNRITNEEIKILSYKFLQYTIALFTLRKNYLFSFNSFGKILVKKKHATQSNYMFELDSRLARTLDTQIHYIRCLRN